MAEIDGATFLSGINAEFIAGLHQRFLEDPGSVDASWQRFFAEIGDGEAAMPGELYGPSWTGPSWHGPPPDGAATATVVQPSGQSGAAELPRVASDSIRALQLIRAYRVRGHLEADLDPLGLDRRRPHPDLDYRTYGFGEADLDREIFINNLGRQRAALREIVAAAAGDLLRAGRRRIHAHPGLGRARLDPGEIRAAAQPHRVHSRAEESDPAVLDRGRDVRALSRPALHRHQALRHRGRRIR